MNFWELLPNLIWLLAGVGVFIVGMNFMSEALEKSAGDGMKKLLEKISNNSFSGVGIGAGVTAIIQSSSATSVMVIGLVNAGVMTLMQATPIIMGANIGTTITGVLVALKNDIFNMIMYALAFAGVMMGFFKNEKIKLAGLLCSGLGLIFVGLNIMSSEDAFGSSIIKELFAGIFQTIQFPILLILVGIIFTALIQSSSAATGVVIMMVGTGVITLDLSLFIILGANIGTCVTALLASVGANANSKRVALIHFMFNVIGTVLFTALIWIFKDPAVNLLVSMFPGDDPMSLQMRVSVFHVVFNVTTTLALLPFVKQLVKCSCLIIKDKKEDEDRISFKYVDERLLSAPHVALIQVKKEIQYMFDLVEENTALSLVAMNQGSAEHDETIRRNEKIINFTNNSLTKFLIELSPTVDKNNERVIGSYFHVLNDLERIGDHAENLHEIGIEMIDRKITFSDKACEEIGEMSANIMEMFRVSKEVFESLNKDKLPVLAMLEESVDQQKKDLISSHFARLAEGNCHVDVSPYFSSVVVGFERMGDHLINVGYSINNPTGSQKENI